MELNVTQLRKSSKEIRQANKKALKEMNGTHKVFVQLPHVVRTSWSPEVVLGILVPLVHPIQGEAVKQRRFLIVLTHLDEFPLPIFVGLLEDGED